MKKRIWAVSLLLILVLAAPLAVSALSTGEPAPPKADWLSADVESLQADGTVTLTFSLAELPDKTPGVNAVAGAVQYDRDSFTLVSGPEPQGKWVLPSCVDNTGAFAGYRTEGGTRDAEPVWKAVFQANPSAQAGEKEFSLTASCSDGEQGCQIEQAVSVSILAAATPVPTPSQEPSVTPAATPTASPAVTPESTPTATPSTEPGVTPTAAPTVLPAETPTAAPNVPPAVPPLPEESPAPVRPTLKLDFSGPYLHGYPNQTLRPEAGITREEASVLLFGLAEQLGERPGKGFHDVPENRWSAEAIGSLSGSEILQGYPDGGFYPKAMITRAEFVSILVRFFETDGARAEGYPDLNGHWAEQEIRWAAAQGWVMGFPDGDFAPNQTVTRAEACAILNRVLNRPKPEQIPPECRWKDLKLNQWYTADVLAAAGN